MLDAVNAFEQREARVKKFLIYCHTHTDGRRYVGQTCNMRRRRGKNYFYTTQEAMNVRWVEHVREAKYGRKDRDRYFQRAIRKYGEGAFSHEVLEEGIETQDAANVAERRWIAQLRTLKPDGFNLDVGGGASPRHDDTRAKMRESALKRHAAMTPKQHSVIAQKARATYLASSTIAERSGAARRKVMSLPTEMRHAIASSARAAVTPEGRREGRRKQLASTTSEQRSEDARKRWTNKTDADRLRLTQRGRDASRRAHEARTDAERSAIGRKGWTPARRQARSDAMHAAWTDERREARSRELKAMPLDARREQTRKAQEALKRINDDRTARGETKLGTNNTPWSAARRAAHGVAIRASWTLERREERSRKLRSTSLEARREATRKAREAYECARGERVSRTKKVLQKPKVPEEHE